MFSAEFLISVSIIIVLSFSNFADFSNTKKLENILFCEIILLNIYIEQSKK